MADSGRAGAMAGGTGKGPVLAGPGRVGAQGKRNLSGAPLAFTCKGSNRLQSGVGEMYGERVLGEDSTVKTRKTIPVALNNHQAFGSSKLGLVGRVQWLIIAGLSGIDIRQKTGT